MKTIKKNYTALKTALAVFLSFLLFFGVSWGYLETTLKKNEASVDTKDYTVPYQSTPDNCGILLQTPLERRWLIYLDFENEQLMILQASPLSSDATEHLGYPIDYHINADFELISGLIDRVGGVELKIDGTTLRYTGVQVSDLLCSDDRNDVKKQVFSAFFENISKNGFSKGDFVYIIDNSETDLTMPVCFDWPKRLEQMCRGVSFVN